MKPLTIEKDTFMLDGKPFTLWGFNYWHSDSPGSDPGGYDWSVLCRYDSELIEREVIAMAAGGATCLRVWFAYTPEHWTADHHLNSTARKNLQHFMSTCEQNGVYVLLVVGGGGSYWGEMRGVGNTFMDSPTEFYATDTLQELFLEDVLTLISEAGLADCSNLLAIDLANEPIFGVPNTECEGVGAAWRPGTGSFNESLRDPAVAAAWDAYCREQFGETKPIPIDRDFLLHGNREELAREYQHFVHHCFNRHTSRFANALREHWPDMLVTIGFGCGGTGADFAGGAPHEALQTLTLTQNVRAMQDGLDFICIHQYDETSYDRLDFLRCFLGSDKPVIIEEFGHIPSDVDPVTATESEADAQAQAELWETVLDGVRRFNYAGALGCNYCDTGNQEPVRNVWSRMGIVKRTGHPKLAHATFVKHATSIDPHADYHPQAIPYDSRAYLHDVEMFGRLFATERDKLSPQ